MKIQYKDWAPAAKSLEVVAQADAIATQYARQGYDLTLRQLYYQFVARGLLPNKQSEYKRLGSIINDARLAGLLDWSHIVDRTRNVAGGDVSRTTPEAAIKAVSNYYAVPLWEEQSVRVEVWVEKEALAGVVQRAAGARRVAYFSCRGYVSQSELWGAAQRLEGYLDAGAEKIVILHLGDHDPSGIDMTRDITDRLQLFMDGDGYDFGEQVEVRRIALNWDQVQQYNPPPNPAKETDARFAGYIRRFGEESWELDALDPAVLNTLIQSHIDDVIEPESWNARIEEQTTERRKLKAISDRWPEILAFMGDTSDVEVDEE